jgi:dipeptidyl aminopeptidase/acylaminoacyl peptidase
MKNIIRILTFYLLLVGIFTFNGCKRDFSSNDKRMIIKRSPPDTTQNPYVLTEGGYPDWSPTGDKLAIIRDDYLWVYNFERNEEERILKNAVEPTFSPDGQKIAFERNRQIWTVDLNTCSEKYLCEGITPSWSENGKWIAFGHKDASKTLTNAELIWGEPSPDSSLYYYDLENNKIERVIVTNWDSLWLNNKYSMFSPDWALNDSIIIFDTEGGIFKVNIHGGNAVYFFKEFKLLKKMDASFDRQPKWCEANQLMAYTLFTIRPFEEDFITDIILDFITPDNSGSAGFHNGSDVTWNPNGEKFAYYSLNNILITKWRELL